MTAVWTAACLASDLPVGAVVPSACEGVDLAIWRSAQGRVSAWKDRCQHRGMRLSHGFVRGETLSCIYHGWVYGTSGGCTRIPAHPELVPPAAIKAEAFACQDIHSVIWVAPAGSGGAPPDLGALEGLRSVVMTADEVQLIAALPAAFTNIAHQVFRGTLPTGPDVTVTLLVQPLSEGRVRVHALTVRGVSVPAKVAASRWIEALRRAAELGGIR